RHRLRGVLPAAPAADDGRRVQGRSGPAAAVPGDDLRLPPLRGEDLREPADSGEHGHLGWSRSGRVGGADDSRRSAQHHRPAEAADDRGRAGRGPTAVPAAATRVRSHERRASAGHRRAAAAADVQVASVAPAPAAATLAAVTSAAQTFAPASVVTAGPPRGGGAQSRRTVKSTFVGCSTVRETVQYLSWESPTSLSMRASALRPSSSSGKARSKSRWTSSTREAPSSTILSAVAETPKRVGSVCRLVTGSTSSEEQPATAASSSSTGVVSPSPPPESMLAPLGAVAR